MRTDQLSEVTLGESFLSPGLVYVKASLPVSVWADDVFVGHGLEVRRNLRRPVQVTVLGDDQARAYAFLPRDRSMPSLSPSVTNLDRAVHESGALLEVRRLVRQLELERLSLERERQRERQRQAIRELELDQAEPVDQATEVEVEPDTATDDQAAT